MAAEVLAHPAVQRLKRVALALGSLTERVVFVGGAIGPLLQVDPPFDEARATTDVDAVIASVKYSDLAPLDELLRARGFRQNPADSAHVHRWRSADGDSVDLVPAGSHPGGSGEVWDQIALDTSQTASLGDGVAIRHASAAAFLGLKWAAFVDRGAKAPAWSHDLEDIVALIASRDTIVAEVREAPAPLREHIVIHVARLLDDSERADILAAHLNNAQDPRGAAQLVVRRMEEIRVLETRR